MFKVMLVDDYEMNLEILEAYLRRSEASVRNLYGNGWAGSDAYFA